MISDKRQVREENLSPRQRAFLGKIRAHDKQVQVLRENGKLVFTGPVIGEGTMPGGESESYRAEPREAPQFPPETFPEGT